MTARLLTLFGFFPESVLSHQFWGYLGQSILISLDIALRLKHSDGHRDCAERETERNLYTLWTNQFKGY